MVILLISCFFFLVVVVVLYDPPSTFLAPSPLVPPPHFFSPSSIPLLPLIPLPLIPHLFSFPCALACFIRASQWQKRNLATSSLDVGPESAAHGPEAVAVAAEFGREKRARASRTLRE